MGRMSNQEKIEFDELYGYVKRQILKYDDSQNLPRNIVLRLKGLKKGKYMESLKQKDNADYSYKTILYTFQICKPKIDHALNSIDFKDESHKVNYIFRIVEANLNDVYMRLKRAEEQKYKTERIDTQFLTSNTGHSYTKKTKSTRKNLDDLW